MMYQGAGPLGTINQPGARRRRTSAPAYGFDPYSLEAGRYADTAGGLGSQPPTPPPVETTGMTTGMMANTPALTANLPIGQQAIQSTNAPPAGLNTTATPGMSGSQAMGLAGAGAMALGGGLEMVRGMNGAEPGPEVTAPIFAQMEQNIEDPRLLPVGAAPANVGATALARLPQRR